MKPPFTLEDIENRAKLLSMKGSRLRLAETKEGWEWEWYHGGYSMGTDRANVNSKAVAFVMALGML